LGTGRIVRGETGRGEPVRRETVKGETVRGEMVKGETVRGEMVRDLPIGLIPQSLPACRSQAGAIRIPLSHIRHSTYNI
jgi:hypothetical protein